MNIIDTYHSPPQSYNPGEAETFKGSAYMAEALLDPVIGHSDIPEHRAMARSLGFKLY